MVNENCPCINKDCSIKGDCLKCVKAHAEKGFIPYCIYVRNGNDINNPDCGCKNEKCVRRTNCEECVKHHGLKDYLPHCLR